MKPTVYVETTVISYLTAWRSPQLVMAANQEVTRTWWDEHRHDFELYASGVVRQEASSGETRCAGDSKSSIRSRNWKSLKKHSDSPSSSSWECRFLKKQMSMRCTLPWRRSTVWTIC